MDLISFKVGKKFTRYYNILSCGQIKEPCGQLAIDGEYLQDNLPGEQH